MTYVACNNEQLTHKNDLRYNVIILYLVSCFYEIIVYLIINLIISLYYEICNLSRWDNNIYFFKYTWQKWTSAISQRIYVY